MQEKEVEMEEIERKLDALLALVEAQGQEIARLNRAVFKEEEPAKAEPAPPSTGKNWDMGTDRLIDRIFQGPQGQAMVNQTARLNRKAGI
jgi:hypothetical protein